MKRTNLIRKSINLALSVLVAGSIMAVGADGSTIASVSGNDAIIGSIVNAAEAQELTATGIITYLQMMLVIRRLSFWQMLMEHIHWRCIREQW